MTILDDVLLLWSAEGRCPSSTSGMPADISYRPLPA
ncbi:hypothetical protein SMD11_0214 [Streptomyces albireticuli]|uniref:Uncharacterized protein n=1 Tax=Streptomyces albireticuli TaxID=1940 RepID=A0A1Z2KV35_9ACTN|nr:hypothetical protein SMD11_0214 [Streptomyces albireticuli]